MSSTKKPESKLTEQIFFRAPKKLVEDLDKYLFANPQTDKSKVLRNAVENVIYPHGKDVIEINPVEKKLEDLDKKMENISEFLSEFVKLLSKGEKKIEYNKLSKYLVTGREVP